MTFRIFKTETYNTDFTKTRSWTGPQLFCYVPLTKDMKGISKVNFYANNNYNTLSKTDLGLT